MNATDFKLKHRIEDVLASRGVKVIGSGNALKACCPLHDDSNPSLSIDAGKQVWFCHAGCGHGSVIDLIMRLENKTLAQVLANGEPSRKPFTKRTVVARYEYHDPHGQVAYRKVKYDPKDFTLESPDGCGGWRPGVNGAPAYLYRLPQVLDAVKAGKRIHICEGEKDCNSVVALGLVATSNRDGASRDTQKTKWRTSDAEWLYGAKEIVVLPDKDISGRPHGQAIARSLAGKVGSLKVVEMPDLDGRPDKDVSDFFEAGGTVEQLAALVEAAPEWKPDVAKDPLSALRDDTRPAIQLPGDERLLSDFAKELGTRLRDANIFTRSGAVVTVNATRDGLRPVEATELRTWVENHLVCFKAWTPKRGAVVQVLHTMSKADADGVSVSPQFHDQLKPVERFAPVRMPVLRGNGALELLPCGYDAETQTFTAESAFTPTPMGQGQAAELLRDLFSEFVFADGGRSLAVAVGGMLTVYGLGLLPTGSLRPVFFYLANAEGAGKTLLVKACCVPILGNAPIGTRPRDEDELKKTLVASVVEARPVVFFDNLKGHFGSEALEAFTSAETFGGRILGQTRTVTARNCATVFLTGNGCTVTPDMRRRSLFAELFLEHERAEDRTFRRELDAAYLVERRAEIVGALWALIQGWDANGRPPASRAHASFPAWARIIGGIVEQAGFACPLDTPAIQTAGDTEGEDMRELINVLLGHADSRSVKFDELVAASRENGLFPHIVPDDDAMDAKAKSRMGRLLQRYDRRLIGGARFILEGKGHSRRFRIERAEPTRSHGQHGTPGQSESPIGK